MNVKRPIIRWHGGKWKLADWIISHFPQHRIYVEPYGGAASVLLKKPRSYAEVYNDMDSELVNLFEIVRSKGKELKRLLELTPFSREEFMLSYEKTDDPLELARRTIIRAYMGHGSNSHHQKSGFRANSNRSGTTPAHDWANYPHAMDTLIKRLQGVIIENRPAIQVMQSHDSVETLHYVDPPYVHASRYSCKGYRYELSNSDHLELSEVLHKLKGTVILSGYQCELYDDLYNDWYRVDRNALADGARPRVESLWLSKLPVQQDIFMDCR